jgi:2-polyprenyl-6-methoxyphenol hydroxylase-like FAD-dependent oxidoreductase
MAKPRALIIGGSVGGLFAAHLLGSIGWDVDVFERVNEDLASRGAGIGTHPALREIMRRLGLSIDNSIVVVTPSYFCRDRTGRLILELPTPRMMSAWAPLYRGLRDNLRSARYHRGKDCVEVRSSGDGVTAVFADGSQATGDLLVAADGIRSTVRSQFLPDVKPDYAGYVAWRALVPERDVAPATRAVLEREYLFCVPEGELALCYVVPARDGDTRVGHRDYNLVWYRPADEAALADLCTDAQGRQHGGSIPPPLIRPEIIAEIRERACADLPPPLADTVLRTEQPFFQAIHDLASPRMVFGRVAVLGDAAFVARPHVGAGVTKAALDAFCLAEVIAAAGGDLDTALARYDRERCRFGEWIVGRGRDLGASIGVRAKTEGHVTQDELDRRSAAVMGGYAANAEELARLTIDGRPPAGGEKLRNAGVARQA